MGDYVYGRKLRIRATCVSSQASSTPPSRVVKVLRPVSSRCQCRRQRGRSAAALSQFAWAHLKAVEPALPGPSPARPELSHTAPQTFAHLAMLARVWLGLSRVETASRTHSEGGQASASRGSNILKSPQKAARKTSERLELIGQEMTEGRAARPSLPDTPRNPPRAARKTWRHREPNGLEMAVSRRDLSKALSGYTTTRNHEADKQGTASPHLGRRVNSSGRLLGRLEQDTSVQC
jgi:hypothetical protein